MSDFDKSFKTYDEDQGYAHTVSEQIEKWLEEIELDCVNKEYVIRVEVSKL